MIKYLKHVFITVFLLIFFVENSYSKELGGICISANNLFVKNSNRYNISPQGVSAGFLIPIRFTKKMEIDFKVKASHHNVKNHYSYYYDHDLNYFISFINEILIGKSVKLKNGIKLTPQIGFGAIGESIYFEWDKGYTHADIFVDLAVAATYTMKTIDFGILINYESDLLDRVNSMLSDKRFIISLILFK
jgi:hypothetical protein